MRAYGIQKRKRRWVDFLDDREHPQHVFMVDYVPDLEDPPLPWREFKRERIEWAWRQYERQVARLTWLPDDILPYVSVRTGTEIFAEAFGCPVYYPPDNMPFALPLIHSAQQVADLHIPEVSTSSLAYLFDIADELVRRAGADVLVKIVDIQSPMDIASLIWDKSTFYPALIETPQAVLELADKVKQLLISFLDEWFARYGVEFIAHYPDYYMPQGITLSEDEIGAVSVSMYEQLFLPELVELSGQYGGMGVHCCAHAQHQWAGLKRIPNLRLLNLVQPEAVLKKAYAAFSDVPQMHSWCGEGEPWTWPETYPQDARVVIQARAETKDEALHVSEKLWQVCQRG